MEPPGRSTTRPARTAALLAAIGLAAAGCVEPPPEPEALGIGARGPEVRAVYEHLRAYGYFDNPALYAHPGWRPAIAEEPADPDVFDEVLERALVLYQRTYHLPPDGTLNEPTRQLMKAPRCSFPDHYQPRQAAADLSSFVPYGSKWRPPTLTYSFANITPDLHVDTVRAIIASAAASWTAASSAYGMSSGMSFSEVGWGGTIDISFAPNDGSGNILAFAYYPPNGDIVFDEDETWSDVFDFGPYYDLETVALHELGHSLGLAHSGDFNAVMTPYYSGRRRALSPDDIEGIRSIYLPPDPIIVNSERCQGLNNVWWGARPGATYYELYRSWSPSFTNPVLEYSGATPSASINVSLNASWYLRVRACSPSGCTALSDQAVAKYWTGICF